jgi:hypothetical protein
MDVLSVLRLLGRHWRVTAPAALLSIFLLGVALKFSSPTYEATGAVVLLSPPEAPDVDNAATSAQAPDVGQNPFVRYGDLSVVADILARVMDSDSRRAEFESQGVTDYDVVVNRVQRGPVVDVTGQGPTPEAATRSTEVVLGEVDSVLSDLQKTEGADPNYFIKAATLEPPSTAKAMYGSTLRSAIAALAVGALATLGLAVLAEAIARQRAARQPAGAGVVMPEAANLPPEVSASNGSRKAGWSGIRSALRLPGEWSPKSGQHERAHRMMPRDQPAQAVPSKDELMEWEADPRESPQPEALHREPAQSKSEEREPAKREPAWHKTFQREPSNPMAAERQAPQGSPAGNGHGERTIDRRL